MNYWTKINNYFSANTFLEYAYVLEILVYVDDLDRFGHV